MRRSSSDCPETRPRPRGPRRDKRLARERLRAAGLPTPDVPWSRAFASPRDIAPSSWPVVVKPPVAVRQPRSHACGHDPAEFVAAFERLRRLLDAADVRAMRDPAADEILIESSSQAASMPSKACSSTARLQTLAIFDKPDPLDGPFFEETIYVTPSRRRARRPASHRATRSAAAAAALGLTHGPVHAECRVNDRGVYVLEVAARPIGGLCARALSFDGRRRARRPDWRSCYCVTRIGDRSRTGDASPGRRA